VAPHEGQTTSEDITNFPQMRCRLPAKPFLHAVWSVIPQDGGQNTSGVVAGGLGKGAACRGVHCIGENCSAWPAPVAEGVIRLQKALSSVDSRPGQPLGDVVVNGNSG
jgi:hypothetical protein